MKKVMLSAVVLTSDAGLSERLSLLLAEAGVGATCHEIELKPAPEQGRDVWLQLPPYADSDDYLFLQERRVDTDALIAPPECPFDEFYFVEDTSVPAAGRGCFLQELREKGVCVGFRALYPRLAVNNGDEHELSFIASDDQAQLIASQHGFTVAQSRFEVLCAERKTDEPTTIWLCIRLPAE